MAVANPYERYRRHDVMMANPMELIVMLYNGCIKQLKLARIAINDKNIEQTNTCLQKAQDIITELTMSLDFKYEISKQLLNLYEFMNYQIMQVNISKDTESIEPLIEMLTSLRDAWVQVQKQSRQTISGVSE